MKKMFFFTRKNGRVIKEYISMNNSQVRNYLNQLRATFGRKNVLVVSSETCMAVELFYEKES